MDSDHRFFRASAKTRCSDLVRKYAKAAKLDGCGPHPALCGTLFVKSLVDVGVGLEQVAMLMGHGSLETTMVYITPSAHDLANAVERVAW